MLSVPPPSRGSGQVAFLPVAGNAGGEIIVGVIRSAVCPGIRVVYFPRAALAVSGVIAARKLLVADVTVARRSAIDVIELVVRVCHIQLLPGSGCSPPPFHSPEESQSSK